MLTSRTPPESTPPEFEPAEIPGLAEIQEAARRIRPWIPCSPLLESPRLSSDDREVRLKLESLSPSGSFKVRGAANALLRLRELKKDPKVITQSSGNHGRALAYMARILGLSATVCLSTLVPEVKRRAIEALGARVVVGGKDQDESLEIATAMAVEEGLEMVPAFDHADVICGQGTLALEILEQWPEVECLLVPLSGGGLLGGMAIAAKSLRPDIRIIGVTVNHGAAMADSLEAGRIVDVDEKPSYADALPGGIPADNRYTVRICRQLLDGVIRVPEDHIAEAMVHALLVERQVLEGGGAIGLAPLLTDLAPGISLDQGKIAVVCTGNNVDMDKLLHLARERR